MKRKIGKKILIIRKKMKTKIRGSKFLLRYKCVEEHLKKIQELYGKAPKLKRSISEEDLEKLYVEIHQGKYGKL